MRKIGIAFLSLFLVSAFKVSAQEADVSLAQSAAESWLAVQDSNNYSGSWAQASSLLQSGVAESDWVAALAKYRLPLGAVKSRHLKSAQRTSNVPAAPTGEYVVIQYETEFASGARAIETITPHKEGDQTWKVSGYYIK